MARRCAANMSISFVEARRTAYPSGKLIQFLFYSAVNRTGVAGMTEILTERLCLRNLEVSDGARTFEYRSHPDIARFQSWGTQSAEAGA